MPNILLAWKIPVARIQIQEIFIMLAKQGELFILPSCNPPNQERISDSTLPSNPQT